MLGVDQVRSGLLSKPTRENLIIILVIALLAGSCWLIGGLYGVIALATGRNPTRLIAPTPGREAAARANARTIIEAIKSYQLAERAYPPSLDTLVEAKYLQGPLQSGVGDNRFTYRIDAEKGFILEYFVGPMYQKDWYESNSDSWFIDR